MPKAHNRLSTPASFKGGSLDNSRAAIPRRRLRDIPYPGAFSECQRFLEINVEVAHRAFDLGYNRWKLWGTMGIFLRMMVGLAAAGAERRTIMIDATYLKAHRTASSLVVKKEGLDAGSAAPTAE